MDYRTPTARLEQIAARRLKARRRQRRSRRATALLSMALLVAMLGFGLLRGGDSRAAQQPRIARLSAPAPKAHRPRVSVAKVSTRKTGVHTASIRTVSVRKVSVRKTSSQEASVSKARLHRGCPIPERFRLTLLAAAHAQRLTPELLSALVWQESRWRPLARSQAGALGLMQLMPATARELKVRPLSARASIRGGARYLRTQLDRFGSTALALAAYNAGPTAVAHFGGVPPYRETEQYVKLILKQAKHYRSSFPACA